MGDRLSETEIRVIREALDDEYKAWATYDQVIRDHGPVRPFTNLREAEARHAQALTRFLLEDGADVPVNPWIGAVPRFATVREACEAGVVAETENAAIHERLLAEPVRDGIRSVLERLGRASRERHLPALRRGADRTGRGAGCGRRPGARGAGRAAGGGPGGGPGGGHRRRRRHRGGSTSS